MSVLEAPFRLPEAPARSDLVAKYFRGLGDPTRVRILELLRDDGELSVGELVARLGQPQPKVSNHLACLRWCETFGCGCPSRATSSPTDSSSRRSRTI